MLIERRSRTDPVERFLKMAHYYAGQIVDALIDLEGATKSRPVMILDNDDDPCTVAAAVGGHQVVT